MTLARRFLFFLTGVSLGVLVVAMIFGPRAFSCSYFPNARALEEARIKPVFVSDEAKIAFEKEGIDSLFLYQQLLKKSTITNFGTDEIRETPCRTYRATYENKKENKGYNFVFKLCSDKTIFSEISKN